MWKRVRLEEKNYLSVNMRWSLTFDKNEKVKLHISEKKL